MTNAKIKRTILKGAMLLALICMLLGGIVSHALTAVNAEGEVDYTPNVYFDYKEALTAPTEINTGDGTYYVPTAYVYYGRRYNSATGGYVPLLNRVLDPNKDNAGDEGAIFLLAEQTSRFSRFSIYANESNAEVFPDENSYVDSELVFNRYYPGYDVYEISYVNTSSLDSLPQELDYIRPITKLDSADETDGLFGIGEDYTYFWSTVDKDGNPLDSEGYPLGEDGNRLADSEGNLLGPVYTLNGSRVFPLSVKELSRYVGSTNFDGSAAKSVFVAADAVDGTLNGWWLRTAIGGGANPGELVGSVDAGGRVTYAKAQDTLAVRGAFNILTEDIAFAERVADKTYRLAFNAPEYKEGAKLEAILTDVKDGTVSFKVRNHIGDSNWQEAGESRISYIVTDSEGVAKYYGTAGAVRATAPVGEKVAEYEDFTLTLPECYVQGDRVLVFSERVEDPDRISTSFVSNYADLGCIHTPAEGDEATCQSKAICEYCGEEYGEKDEANHVAIADVWTYNGDGTHYRECIPCNVKVYSEPCSFGHGNHSSPSACYESSCNGCGRTVDSPSLHYYDERGICTLSYGEMHYELPKLENYINIGFTARVGTVGEWNALAEWLNGGGYLHFKGEVKDVIITADLDFTGIPFIPMGTPHEPVKNLDITGHRYTFSGINYTASDAPAGIIAVGEAIDVDNITVTDSAFSGTDVGSIVGRLVDTEKDASEFYGIAVTDVTLSGNNAGGIVGTLSSEASLEYSFIWGVTKDGENLDFSSNGKLIPTPASIDNEGIPYGGCYRLTDEGDESFAFTADEFASGEITYRLRRIDPSWRQAIGAHRHPVYCEDESVKRVYRVVNCDGSGEFYSNEDLGQIQHGGYTSVVDNTFEWVDGVGTFGVGFKVDVICGQCQKPVTLTLEAEWIPHYNASYTAIVKMEFNAYVETENGREKLNSEPKITFSQKLEELIGMTPVTVKYNGWMHYPDPLFNNIREGFEYYSDFEAYFIDPATGEELSGVRDVGTYDVLIVGKRGFKGYEYLYEDVFTVEKAKVTVNPLDVRKLYDGSKHFDVEYELDGDDIFDLEFDISLEDAPSERVGEYTLKVIADLTSHGHGENLELVLLSESVTALILPDVQIGITENESNPYPATIVYGDPVPEVKAVYFKTSAPATLSYRWFKAGHDHYNGYYAENAVSAPTDAGKYILRIRATSTDGTLLSNTLDIEVEVLPRPLTLNLYAPDGVEMGERYGEPIYLLDRGEAFTYDVTGFAAGDTLESLGMKVEIYLRSSNGTSLGNYPNYVNPDIPYGDGYQVSYNVTLHGNYEVTKYVIHRGGTTVEDEYGVLYVKVKNPMYVYPTVTEFVADGAAISPNMFISIPADYTPDGEFEYEISVFGPGGSRIAETYGTASELDEIYLYNHTLSETWYPSHILTRGVFTAEGGYRVVLDIEGSVFESTFTLSFFNDAGEGVAEIVEPGLYTVRVTDADGNEREASLYAQQRIVMNLKPHEYSISEGRVEFDPTKVIMEAGSVIHLNHTLVDVVFYVNESQGKIYVEAIKVVDKNGNDVSRLYSVDTERPSWPSHTDSFNICHVFDNVCDRTCNIGGCDYVRGVSHSGGSATCSERAICERCGNYYGELSSSRHLSEGTIVYPNISDPDEGHLLVYVCCGGTKELIPHTASSPATCTERAVCTGCGWEYGELDPDNHSMDNPTYTPSGESHKVTHPCCGAVEEESHSGGTAYCNAKAVCSLCGGAYGELNPENHAEKLQYIPDEADPTRHNAYYACCEKSTSYTHSGGNATCIAKAECEYCKAPYGELEPSDHASEAFAYRQDMDNPSLHTIHHACCDVFIGKDYHEGGKANCQSPALCSLCGTPYGEKDYENHASDGYSYYPDHDNKELHVKVAACCGEFAGTEQHAYGEPTCTHAARCVCGAENGEPIAHVYDNDCDSFCNTCGEKTRADSFHVGKDGKPCEVCGEMIPKEPMSASGVSAIVTGSTVVASGGGFALFWFVIKKKSLAELLGLILK